jgi:hypothetical protein
LISWTLIYEKKYGKYAETMGFWRKNGNLITVNPQLMIDFLMPLSSLINGIKFLFSESHRKLIPEIMATRNTGKTLWMSVMNI